MEDDANSSKQSSAVSASKVNMSLGTQPSREDTPEAIADQIIKEIEEEKKGRKKSKDGTGERKISSTGVTGSKTSGSAYSTILGVLSGDNYSKDKFNSALKSCGQKDSWIKKLNADEVLTLLDACLRNPIPICPAASDLALAIVKHIPSDRVPLTASFQASLVTLYDSTIETRENIAINDKNELPKHYAAVLSRICYLSRKPQAPHMYLLLWKRLFVEPNEFLQRLLEAYLLYDIELFANESSTDRIVFIRLLIKYLSEKIKTKGEFLAADDLEEDLRIFSKFLDKCLQNIPDETAVLHRAGSDLLRLMLGALQKSDGLPSRSIQICGEIATVLLDEHPQGGGRSKTFYRKIKRTNMKDIVSVLTLMSGIRDDRSTTTFSKNNDLDSNAAASIITSPGNQQGWRVELQRQLENSVFETGADYCMYEMVPYVTKIIELYKNSSNPKWVEFVQKVYPITQKSVDRYLPAFFTALSQAKTNEHYGVSKALLDLLVLMGKECPHTFTTAQLKTVETFFLTFQPELSVKAFAVAEVLSQNNAALFAGRGKGYFAASKPCGPETQIQVVTILGNIGIHGTQEEATRIVGIMDSEIFPTNNKKLSEAVLKAWRKIAASNPEAIIQCKDRLMEFENDPVLRPSALKIVKVMKKSSVCVVM